MRTSQRPSVLQKEDTYRSHRHMRTLSHRYTHNSLHNERVPVTRTIKTHTLSLYTDDLWDHPKPCVTFLSSAGLFDQRWLEVNPTTTKQYNALLASLTTLLPHDDIRTDLLACLVHAPASHVVSRVGRCCERNKQLHMWKMYFYLWKVKI